MQHEFWHQRWQENQIGFHEPEANELLVEHFFRINLAHGSKVLVPLCGKSHDLGWLADNGFDVVGVELSTIAAESFFAERGVSPHVTDLGEFQVYRSENIRIFLGDVFKATRALLGDIDAIYDRAALVALPEDTRVSYTKHLVDMSSRADQLLITYEYDQTLMNGPPFSVSENELMRHYADSYNIEQIKRREVPSKLKGQTATETVWLLRGKS